MLDENVSAKANRRYASLKKAESQKVLLEETARLNRIEASPHQIETGNDTGLLPEAAIQTFRANSCRICTGCDRKIHLSNLF